MSDYTRIHDLVKAYQYGSQEAIIELIQLFDGLIKSVVDKYKKEISPIAQQDIYNHGVLTFLRLTMDYDSKKGVDFPGYIKYHFEHTFTDTLGEI